MQTSSQSCLKCFPHHPFLSCFSNHFIIDWVAHISSTIPLWGPTKLFSPCPSHLSPARPLPPLMSALKAGSAGLICCRPTPDLLLSPGHLLLNAPASAQFSCIQHFPPCPSFFCLPVVLALSFRALTLPSASASFLSLSSCVFKLCPDLHLRCFGLHRHLLRSSFLSVISVIPSSPPLQHSHCPASVESKPRCEDHFFDWYFDGRSGFPENFHVHLPSHQCCLSLSR